jgi:hypothetical protein
LDSVHPSTLTQWIRLGGFPRALNRSTREARLLGQGDNKYEARVPACSIFLFSLTFPYIFILALCSPTSRFFAFSPFHATLASSGVLNGIIQSDDMLNLERPSPCNRVQ